MMKYVIITLSLFMAQTSAFLFGQEDIDRETKIAQEMRDRGSKCQFLTSAKMAEERQEFLNNNKDATVADLVGAIEKEIDGQDIISFLRSFNCEVCDEYAASVTNDHGRGSRAKARYLGNTKIETVMSYGFL